MHMVKIAQADGYLVVGNRESSVGSIVAEMKSNLIAQMRRRIKLEIAV